MTRRPTVMTRRLGGQQAVWRGQENLEILREGGVAPLNPRRAYVDDFALRIGQRATLVPSAGGRAYGMLVALTHSELDRLYTAPGLEQYRPEAVLARPLEGTTPPALCYNLREAPRPHERNPEYAARLRRALGKLDFPPEDARPFRDAATEMTEIRKADPAVRRRALLLVALGTLVGALLIVGWERYRLTFRDWLSSEPRELAHRVKLVFLLTATALSAPLAAFAARLWLTRRQGAPCAAVPAIGVPPHSRYSCHHGAGRDVPGARLQGPGALLRRGCRPVVAPTLATRQDTR